MIRLFILLAFLAFAGAALAGPATVGAIASASATSALPQPSAWSCAVITLGDSMTAGLNGPGTPSAWPTTLAGLLPGSAGSIYNVATGGWKTSDVLNDFNAHVAPHLPSATGQPAIATVYIGNNNFLSEAASVTYASTKTIWSQLRAGGAKVVVILNLGAAGQPAGSNWDNQRLAYRTLILSDPTLYDLVIDPSTIMPDPANAYFQYGDGHLNYVGAAQLGTFIYAQINASGLLP